MLRSHRAAERDPRTYGSPVGIPGTGHGLYRFNTKKRNSMYYYSLLEGYCYDHIYKTMTSKAYENIQ